ncbi:MAG TPA: DNA-3-methyladenine glycosylase I [Candidatus Deferrimicrobium sp.]|nr:DNA-3-methyladenine glycosylase I [Candidatus Deferrimicrobium sp.]
MARCGWAGDDPLMVAYHDDEWGLPVHDEQRLFEMLCLEGAQAGLSWATILRRREGYRAAYEGFDAVRMAAWDGDRQARLLADTRIIRNRAKVRAFRDNAIAVLRLREEEGGLTALLWSAVGGTPIVNRFARLAELPARTALSDELARALAARGFRFVGPVIVYAYLQSIGVVNDHLLGCFRHPESASGDAAASLG